MESYPIPNKSLRKLNTLFRHEQILRHNTELQNKILEWATEMLTESRQEWNSLRATTFDAVIKIDRKQQAIKRAQQRDKKYAMFRDYFKNLQHKHFEEQIKLGKTLVANQFVIWFMENKPSDIEIPYKTTNRFHKLLALARANNREFKNSVSAV